MQVTNPDASPVLSRQTGALAGEVTPPGDKSISHRALMFGALAQGETVVSGLLEGHDVLATAKALRALGAGIEKEGSLWRITGVGGRGLSEPEGVLDMGNSGTSARLLAGLLSTQPFTSFMTGDASLCRRPMGRVIEPLSQIGARFVSRTGGRLPLAILGAPAGAEIAYRLPVASAQVKSAILLAGLRVKGVTTVIETVPTRDPTERMLAALGAKIDIAPTPDGAEAISITGFPELVGRELIVPGDISSAAFPMVAALLRPGSELRLRNVGINPRRAGLLTTLLEMGANITLENQRDLGGEPVADLLVKASDLRGVEVPASRAASMIDEYPILAIAAACAQGTSRLLGLGELRVKESDRLALMAQGLVDAGVDLAVDGDDLMINGRGAPPRGGASVKTAMDHRIAMSFLVLGMASCEPMTIDDGTMIATSFPAFIPMMNALGGRIEGAGE